MTQAQVALGVETHEDWIVVDDPRGKWGEGSLLKLSQAKQLRAKDVSVLPVHPELFRSSGVGGFFKRSWGSGYPLSDTVPMYQCPVTLALDHTRTARLDTGVAQVAAEVHWVARVVPREEDAQPTGQVRLASDSSQQLAKHAPAVAGRSSVVNLQELGPPDKRGGWTVRGKLLVTPPMGGHYGFGLFGVGPRLAVRWIAASVTFTPTR